MDRKMLIHLSVIAAMGLAALGSAAPQGASPFVGHKEAIDNDARDIQLASNPRIVASVVGDWMWTTEFAAQTELAISVYESMASKEDGQPPIWGGTIETDDTGFALVAFSADDFYLVPGNYLIVSDETNIKGLVLESITLEVFDPVQDLMTGTAPPKREVWVAAGPQEWQIGMTVRSHPGTGEWKADFQNLRPPFDITEDMRVWSYAQIFDEDGDINEADPPVAPPPGANQPTGVSDCKNDGWRSYPHAGFRNQGDCVRFVVTGAFVCRDALGCVSYGQDDPVRIATALAFSYDFGFDSQRGVEIALARQAELFGHSLELRAEDDGCSSEGGAAAASLIVADPSIAAVVGTSCSSAAESAAPIISAAGLSMVSPSSTSPYLTDAATHSASFLRTAWNDADNAYAMAKFLTDRGERTSLVIVQADSNYSDTIGHAFVAAFEELEGTNLGFAVADPSGGDIDDVLNAVIGEEAPDALYFPVFDPLGSAIVSAVRSRAELDDTIMASNDVLFYQEFIDALGPDVERMFFGVADDSFTQSPAYADFSSEFQSTYGVEPLAFFSAHAFDAAKMTLRAIEATAVIDAGSTLHIGRQALRNALFNTEGLEGLTGTITCDTFGDCGVTGFTVVKGEPSLLFLRVNYGHDWVESFYEAGHQVDLVVTEADGTTVKATATVVTEAKDFWDGGTGFQTVADDWSPTPPDLQPYDWVFAQVDNGVSVQVQLGDIQGAVDIWGDSVTGTIEAAGIEGPVPVECLDWGSGGGPFNKDGGTVEPNGGDPYNCSWDPETEWDLQAFQDVGVGYVTPDGHWVANAFHAEHWVMAFTYDLAPGFWSEGEHDYLFLSTGNETPGPVGMLVSTTTDGGTTPIYDGYVLLRPFAQRAWTGSACAAISTVNPDQPTRFVWGEVNNQSMSYEEVLTYFAGVSVAVSWDSQTGGPVDLIPGEIVPMPEWPDYACLLTEHP